METASFLNIWKEQKVSYNRYTASPSFSATTTAAVGQRFGLRVTGAIY
jgi:hypothetical protein